MFENESFLADVDVNDAIHQFCLTVSSSCMWELLRVPARGYVLDTNDYVFSFFQGTISGIEIFFFFFIKCYDDDDFCGLK